MAARSQPKPFDPDFPRYLPAESLPAYRHLPGHTPHPFNDSEGHSYGQEPDPAQVDCDSEAWRDNGDYLRGVDLFNQAYWWEATHCWQSLWGPACPVTKDYIQGLDSISEALLHHHLRDRTAMLSHAAAGEESLTRALNASNEDVYMGLNLRHFLKLLDSLFEPFEDEGCDEALFDSPAAFAQIRLIL
jgi:hypothetical protein